MKKQIVLVLSTVLLSTGVFAQAAGEYASKAEAEAMVKKAVVALKGNRGLVLEQITQKDSQWISKDLYPVVYSTRGEVLAHGQNAKMVGKDLIDLKDPDGKLFVKERVDLANSKGKFWQDYKFTDPVSKKALPKEMYCEKEQDMIVCAGVYKR